MENGEREAQGLLSRQNNRRGRKPQEPVPLCLANMAAMWNKGLWGGKGVMDYIMLTPWKYVKLEVLPTISPGHLD